jgi:diguanylate cyclase (GGDEF)-like protein/PAS domain S-box-containing protein
MNPTQTPAFLDQDELYPLSLAASATLDYHANVEGFGRALVAVKGVHGFAMWLPAAPKTEPALLLSLPAKVTAPAFFPKSHPLRQEFGRRPFVLGAASDPRYRLLGKATGSVAVFALPDGAFCALGLDCPHDGSAGAAVKALRPVLNTWSNALKACRTSAALKHHRAEGKQTQKVLRAAKTRLKQVEADFRDLFENAVEGIFRTTPSGQYLRVNPALARIYGYDNPQHMLQELTDISRQLYVEPGRRDEFKALMESSDELRDFESRIYRRDGSILWINENVRAVRSEGGKLLYYEGMVMNITKRKNAEAQMSHAALHDALTGLANRSLFLDRLRHAVDLGRRKPGYLFGVLYIDLDRFKLVNDSLGHQAGDQLLKAVAQRLEAAVRPGDSVARMGGDEFAVLVEDIRDQSDALRVAERVVDNLDEPVHVRGHELSIGASIGIALAHAGIQDPEDLLRDADTAMYRAKGRVGPARIALFNAGMHEKVLERLEMEASLRKAIGTEEIVAYYQPIVRLKDGQIAGFEALARWKHPNGLLISPIHFIPIAEEIGLIDAIGEQILDQALARLAAWGPRAAGIFMSVNLSPKQLESPTLVERVAASLQVYKIEPSRLKLEITESLLMRNPEKAAQTLHDLRALGVRLSMDDFGTGFSSLSVLHRFPLDTLKVDRSFVQAVTEGGSNLTMVKTIVALAHQMNMDVVAEGIEEEYHARYLKELGCEYGQGYLYAKPLEAGPARAMLSPEPSFEINQALAHGARAGEIA